MDNVHGTHLAAVRRSPSPCTRRADLMMDSEQSIMPAEPASDRLSSGPLTLAVRDGTTLSQNTYNVTAHQSTLNFIQGHQINTTIQGSYSSIRFRCMTLSVLALDEHRQKILRWLSAPDPSSNHNAACKKQQPTTGAWFIEGDAFANWKEKPRSFIWLHGIRTFCWNVPLVAAVDCLR